MKDNAFTLDDWTVLARELAKSHYGWADFTSNEVRSGFSRRLTPRQFVEELTAELAIAPRRRATAACTSADFDRRPQ